MFFFRDDASIKVLDKCIVGISALLLGHFSKHVKPFVIILLKVCWEYSSTFYLHMNALLLNFVVKPLEIRGIAEQHEIEGLRVDVLSCPDLNPVNRQFGLILQASFSADSTVVSRNSCSMYVNLETFHPKMENGKFLTGNFRPFG